MALDPRDPDLAKKISDVFADDGGEPPSYQDWRESQPDANASDDQPRVARPFDEVQREEDDRLAETRRRRDLGREGRDAERPEEMRGDPAPPASPPTNPFESQSNSQMTEYERRSLEFLESIDTKLSELGTLQ